MMNMSSLQEARTYREALSRASSLLREAGEHDKIAEWMLLHLINAPKTNLLRILDEELPEEQKNLFMAWIGRVKSGEPYQYVIGVQEFYGRHFSVNPAVLIPRLETEQMITEVLPLIAQLKQSRNPAQAADVYKMRVIDVGTGSGNIAITLKLEDPSLDVYALDNSGEAMAVAQENAITWKTAISFQHRDIRSGFQADERYHVIVSNPPYIARGLEIDVHPNVLKHEPRQALFAENEGLFYYELLIKLAREHLYTPGLLVFEIGLGQAQAVHKMLISVFPRTQVNIHQDLQGISRIITARIES